MVWSHVHHGPSWEIFQIFGTSASVSTGYRISQGTPVYPSPMVQDLMTQGCSQTYIYKYGAEIKSGWLVVSTPLKNISQIESSPQVGMKI